MAERRRAEPRKRDVKPDEGELFRRAMDGVKPLKHGAKNKIVPVGEPAKTPPVKSSPDKVETPAKGVGPPPGPPRVSPQPKQTHPELEHGKAPGLDKRTALRMKRGKVVIDGRIDLHGLTQQEAHRALDAFLAAAQAAGRRCVLVITGKGSVRGSSGDVGGVLRANVPRWLNEPANRARINAFSHAAPQHGGAGALYVMIKRRK